MKTYEDFAEELNTKIKSDDDFYYELLITVIKNPQRYTGIFRVSNAKTKLIQNVTQSREIKFGDFMEDIITWYISEMGYENLDKNISSELKADQLFIRDKVIYLIEQKFVMATTAQRSADNMTISTKSIWLFTINTPAVKLML